MTFDLLGHLENQAQVRRGRGHDRIVWAAKSLRFGTATAIDGELLQLGGVDRSCPLGASRPSTCGWRRAMSIRGRRYSVCSKA